MMERPQLGTCLYMISYVSDRDPGLGRYIVRPVILCACYEGPPRRDFPQAHRWHHGLGAAG